MAKHTPKDDRGRVKFRVIEFELDGSDSTLQDAIKGLTTALGERAVPRVVHRLPPGSEKAAASLENALEAEPVDNEEEAADAPRAPRTVRSKRSIPVPEIIPDLEFDSGDVALKVFLEEKKPSGDNKRYLTMAYWLKHHRKIESINANHIYTCYRAMGWNVPKDPSKPLRNMKQTGWFVPGTQSGEFKLSHVGEGVVNDLGSK